MQEPAARNMPAREFRIESIRPYLYYHEVGEFGKRNLTDPNMVLRNVVVGGGDAEASSSITLLTVHVVGPEFSSDTRLTLKMSARTKAKILLEKEVPLSRLYSHRDEVFVPFLLYETGCEEIEVTAKLEGRGTATLEPVIETIPFDCRD